MTTECMRGVVATLLCFESERRDVEPLPHAMAARDALRRSLSPAAWGLLERSAEELLDALEELDSPAAPACSPAS